MKTERKLSKRLRFEVFKRDGFRCQYCGAFPPDVVLECDHIVPLCEGGSNEPENLTTACLDCNRGKSGKLLSDIKPSPDAEILYRQAIQEEAELRRHLEALRQLQETKQELTEYFWDVWDSQCSATAPDADVLHSLLDQYHPEIIDIAIRSVAYKREGGYLPDYVSAVRYLRAICKQASKEREVS